MQGVSQPAWHKGENLKAIASINARMGSTRLPGKVMMNIGDKTVLDHIVDRLRLCTTLHDICLATTFMPEDDILEAWAHSKGIPCFRGEVDDVLKRTVDAHRQMGSSVVVRVCGDTPFIDPETIDFEILMIKHDEADICMSTNRRKFPHGTTAHVCKFSDLEWVEAHIQDPIAREHVTLYLYEHPEKYRVYEIQGCEQWECEGQRLQIDYKEDLEVAQHVYRAIGDKVSIGDIVKFLRSPEGKRVREINAHCAETIVRK